MYFLLRDLQIKQRHTSSWCKHYCILLRDKPLNGCIDGIELWATSLEDRFHLIFGGQKSKLRQRHDGYQINHFFPSLLTPFAVRQGLTRNNVNIMTWEWKWSVSWRNWLHDKYDLLLSLPLTKELCVQILHQPTLLSDHMEGGCCAAPQDSWRWEIRGNCLFPQL